MAKVSIENREVQTVITNIERVAVIEVDRKELDIIISLLQDSNYTHPINVSIINGLLEVLQPKLREM